MREITILFLYFQIVVCCMTDQPMYVVYKDHGYALLADRGGVSCSVVNGLTENSLLVLAIYAPFLQS